MYTHFFLLLVDPYVVPEIGVMDSKHEEHESHTFESTDTSRELVDHLGKG
jgi:hypothetical protein